MLTPVQGSPFAAGSGTNSVAIDPMGKFAYAPNPGSNNISAYGINAKSGVLTPVQGSPFPVGNAPWSLAIDPTGKFAYVIAGTSRSPNGVYAYVINASSGALRGPVKGSNRLARAGRAIRDPVETRVERK